MIDMARGRGAGVTPGWLTRLGESLMHYPDKETCEMPCCNSKPSHPPIPWRTCVTTYKIEPVFVYPGWRIR